MDNEQDYEEIGAPLSHDYESSMAIDYAVHLLTSIDNQVDEKDYETSVISLSVKKVVDVCELLLMYADLYESVDVESMFEMAEFESEIPAINLTNTVH